MSYKIFTPLRYPGGKGKIINFVKELVRDNFPGQTDIPYIEPYAGGAAIALALLIEGYVSKIYINDYDIAIYSFWEYCIKRHHIKFINKIRKTEINMAEWEKQRAIYANPKTKEGFDLGFAAFFLNRCNYSGIIKGGPIGGYAQKGAYSLDCRFNKETLIKRVLDIARYKDKIFIFNEDTKLFLQRKDLQEVLKKGLIYLDHPYYKKGDQLYKNFYTHNDHIEIAKLMHNLHTRWIISYDNQPEIKELYKKFLKKEFNLIYYAGLNSNKRYQNGKEVIFFSKKIKNIPETVI